jgi:putative tryptophan/tyrosine transport system substrate-binding protein
MRYRTSIGAIALALGLKLVTADAVGDGDIDKAFAQFVEPRIDGLIIASAVFFNRNRERLIALAASHGIPSIFNGREFTTDGGLISYGPDSGDAYRQAGLYVARILKGDKPADLPVIQATRFELVINRKTAKGLNLTIPPGLLAIADEVIE